FVTGVALRCLTKHGTGFSIKSRVKRKRTMSIVLKSVALRPTRREGKNGILTIQGLNGALLIDTEDRSVLRRIKIKANDICGFLLEIWIVGLEIALHPLWLQVELLPGPSNHHMADSQLLRQLAGGPVGRAIRWLSLRRPGEDFGFHFRRQHLDLASRIL